MPDRPPVPAPEQPSAPPWIRELLPLGAALALLVGDVAIAQVVGTHAAPAVLTGLAVVAVAVVMAPWPVPSALGAAGTSLAVSGLVGYGDRFLDGELGAAVIRVRFETEGWLGLAELAALGWVHVRVIRDHPARQAALPVAGLAAALLAVVAWRHDGGFADLLEVPLVVGFGATLALGAYLRWVDQSRFAAEDAVRRDERTAIARELHDLTAHHVTGMVLQAQAAKLLAHDARPQVREALDAIEQAGADALRSMRAIVGALRGEDGAPVSPTASVDDLRRLATDGGPGDLAVRVVVDERTASLPEAVVVCVHRIVLEAVTNARRHAPAASEVVAEVRCGDGEVTVTVDNDGPLAPPRSPSGFGLVGITERVQALGGRLSVGPRDEGGWRVSAELPVGARVEV